VAKAFDTVWYGGLVYKLHVAGVPLAMVKLINSFLENRNFHAKIGNVFSRVLEHWNSLTLHFQATVSENNLPSAKAILNALNNPVYKLYLQFLKFNLERITQLNLEFQSEQSKMPVYLDKITTLYKSI
jgi:hypothetical protein